MQLHEKCTCSFQQEQPDVQHDEAEKAATEVKEELPAEPKQEEHEAQEAVVPPAAEDSAPHAEEEKLPPAKVPPQCLTYPAAADGMPLD